MESREQTLRVAVRVPLEAIRDIDFPQTADGYLDVPRLMPLLSGVVKTWIADPLLLSEQGIPLPPPRIVAARISLPSDRSFAAFATAWSHIQEPPPSREEQLIWRQVFLDAALEYRLRGNASEAYIQPRYAGLGTRVTTSVQFDQRVYTVPGDTEAFPLTPSFWYTAGYFLRLGFLHILEGTDHLLFLLCLVLPIRRFRPLIGMVTAFTLSHSITLAASAFDMAPGGLWFPPLVELLIAASILVMALGNIAGAGPRRTWWLTFGFGLIHGFGFSFALRESLQFAGPHLISALFSFNAGVELGQLSALLIVVPCVTLLFRYAVAERMGIIIASALIAHTAVHWTAERWEIFSRFSWPPIMWSAAAGAAMLRWAMLLFIVVLAARWAIRRVAPDRKPNA
jgi:hypothetical protein